MTATTNTTYTAKTAAVRNTLVADELLRDMAYVLKLTRRVKEEMSADRATTQTPAGRKAERTLVA